MNYNDQILYMFLCDFMYNYGCTFKTLRNRYRVLMYMSITNFVVFSSKCIQIITDVFFPSLIFNS